MWVEPRLEKLQSSVRQDQAARVNVAQVAGDALAACADREPKPELEGPPAPLWVSIDREKLTMAVTHAIRNAQEATEAGGRVMVRVSREGPKAVIVIEDTGVGMAQDFVRDQLFKPFQSTKGAKGMGIGAYQIRETVRAAAGEVEVESERGRGTVVRMILPLVETPMAADRLAEAERIGTGHASVSDDADILGDAPEA